MTTCARIVCRIRGDGHLDSRVKKNNVGYKGVESLQPSCKPPLISDVLK